MNWTFEFGSGHLLNFGPNHGPVLKSSGSNLGSEPNIAITTDACVLSIGTIDPIIYSFILPVMTWKGCNDEAGKKLSKRT